MSEMEYEPAPEVRVPLVRRSWLTGAYGEWARAVYPPRRGATILIGCLFIAPWMVWQLFKLWLFLFGVLVLLVCWPPWIAHELITYKQRYKREVLRQWGPYMGELHNEG
jgi:hypothetical protein